MRLEGMLRRAGSLRLRKALPSLFFLWVTLTSDQAFAQAYSPSDGATTSFAEPIDFATDQPSLERARAWMSLAKAAGPDGSASRNKGLLQAYRVLQAWRRANGVDRTSLSGGQRFRDQILPIYQASADAFYETAANDEERISRLIALGEAERINQIEALAGDCSPPVTPFTTSRLRADEIIVYPVVGERRLYILTGTSAGWRITISKDGPNEAVAGDVARLAKTFFEKFKRAGQDDLLSPGTPIDDWGDREAPDLFRLILEPAIGALPAHRARDDQDVGVVIVFPDPALRSVVWSALFTVDPTTRARNYLIEHSAVAIAPALSYVRVPDEARTGRMLVAGSNEDPGSIDDCAEVDLAPSSLDPYNEKLQDFVCELAAGPLKNRVRVGPIGKRFSADNLDRMLRVGGYSSVLIAAKADFGKGAPIIFSQPGDDRHAPEIALDEFAAGVSEKKLRDSRFDLLILVACEGTTSDETSLGLAGAAVRAGASTTFGSIIRVAAGAPQAMLVSGARTGQDWLGLATAHDPGFLEGYFSGAGAAKALRRIQAHYLNTRVDMTGDVPGYSVNEPVAWGSYEIVGWWR